MCVCVRSVKTEIRKTEARVYAVCTSEPPGAGPQLGREAGFPFPWTSTLCLVGLDQGQRACPISPPVAPLFSPWAQSTSSCAHFAGVAQHGNVPTESLKISQSKKITTKVVRVVAQCQWGACTCRCAITCDP